LADFLNVDLRIEPTSESFPPFVKNRYGDIKMGQLLVGKIGQINLPDNAGNNSVVGFNLDISASGKLFSLTPHYHSVPSQPPIIEDLTFQVSKKTNIGPLSDEIFDTSKLVERVDFIKSFENEEMSNVSFRIIYRHNSRPLTDKELMPVRKKIVANLKKSFSASLVGSLD